MCLGLRPLHGARLTLGQTQRFRRRGQFEIALHRTQHGLAAGSTPRRIAHLGTRTQLRLTRITRRIEERILGHHDRPGGQPRIDGRAEIHPAGCSHGRRAELGALHALLAVAPAGRLAHADVRAPHGIGLPSPRLTCRMLGTRHGQCAVVLPGTTPGLQQVLRLQRCAGQKTKQGCQRPGSVWLFHVDAFSPPNSS